MMPIRRVRFAVAAALLAACSSASPTTTPEDASVDGALLAAIDGGSDATLVRPDGGTAGGEDAGGTKHDGSAPDAAHVLDGGENAGQDAAPPPYDAGDVDASAFETAGASTSIVAFNNTLVCFGNNDGGPGACSRTVDENVTFPKTGAFSQIVLNVTLNCPSNGCDPWDRAGSIDLVKPATEDGGAETLLELARFMTPYGITSGVNSPPSWDIDVTELRPLLSGTVDLRVFIDTWVPQGNAAAYGGGWVVGATFNMTGGIPSPNPVVVMPIWPWVTTGREPTEIVYGDETQPIDKSLPPQSLALPRGPSTWGIRSQITGHGQANLDNCAEFCSRNHTWSVGSTPNESTVWRTDCSNYPSEGTYQNSRAGWCPGADVIPWDIDVTSQVAEGGPTTFTYGVDPYLNTCNQGAPDGGLCSGCASGESCAYDGSDHTQPFYYVSSLLIGFE